MFRPEILAAQRIREAASNLNEAISDAVHKNNLRIEIFVPTREKFVVTNKTKSIGDFETQDGISFRILEEL